MFTISGPHIPKRSPPCSTFETFEYLHLRVAEYFATGTHLKLYLLEDTRTGKTSVRSNSSRILVPIVGPGEDNETHFSGPPRRWGGNEWSAKAMVFRVRENACPRRIWPSLAQVEGEDDEMPRPCPPHRWGGHGKNTQRRVSASARHKVRHCNSRVVPYGVCHGTETQPRPEHQQTRKQTGQSGVKRIGVGWLV